MYKFDPTGLLLEAIAPPEAFLPLRKGVRSFASNNPPIYNPDLDVGDNDSGRTDNQGFEGSALSTDGKYLYSLLQSATVQDGGLEKYTNRNVRFLQYDITKSTPELVAEYVLQLPTYNNPNMLIFILSRVLPTFLVYTMVQPMLLLIQILVP
ncbi:unnamed protein product [[Candida] boidinii]|nr:unnamed protein product [[Candida] boidinii]